MNKAIEQTVTLLGHLGENFDGASKFAERAAAQLDKAAGGASSAGRAAREAAADVDSGSEKWREYAKVLSEANQAYREFKQGQVTGEGGGSNIPSNRGAQNELLEIAKATTAGVIPEIQKVQAAEERAATETAAMWRKVSDNRIADAKRESSEENRLMEARAAANQQARQSELANLNSGQKDTHVQAYEARNAAMAKASQQTALYNQYLYDQDKATQGVDSSLARLRYALYDISGALTVGGAAAAAFTVAMVGSAISYEREFAQVRRTVGVTGEAADELYDSFAKLTTEIPASFAELSQIGAAAGQLGVAEERVASFTETVAKFAATTDVTTDASATAFGRLDQLIDGVDGRYQNLASSILNVGINSVATESQIIGIASQIAATGDQAGLTADEIIGLSGSLASLGIAPEAARGTILRVFSQINSAVSNGGDALNDFAAISNKSAGEFATGWGSDFTGTFLAFLEGINANGGNAEAAIRGLGITAARDVNALLKLSQNTDAVSSNLGLAATGFESGAVLAANFGITAETTAAKLQIFAQTAQTLFATIGEGTTGPLSHFLSLGIDMLKLFTQLASSPVGQFFGTLSVAIGGTVAVMLLLAATGARTAGTFLALKTALGESYVQSLLASGGMKGYTATLLGAAGASAAFGAALKATGVGLLVTGGLWLASEAITQLAATMASGKDKATEYFGSLDGLSDAVRADNAVVFAQQLGKVNEAVAVSTQDGGSWIDVLTAAAAAQEELRAKTEEAGDGIDEQTLRIGTNTKEWLRNALASSPAFQEIFKNLDQLSALTSNTSFTAGSVTVDYESFDLEEYLNIASTQGTEASRAYIESWQLGLETAFANEGVSDTYQAVIESLGGGDALGAAYDAGDNVAAALEEGLAAAASGDAQNALLDQLVGPLEEGAEEASNTFKALMDDIYGTINASAELASQTMKLGEEFATSGSQVAFSGATMQAVISSIYSSSSGAGEAASRLQGLFNALIQGGYASVAQLQPLQAIIASLAGGKSVQAAAFDMTNFAGGIKKVETAAAGKAGKSGAANALRTLVDYAGDLQKVFSRSFDIRFGGAAAFDDISGGWNKIRDAITATNAEISKYQNEMQSLSADKAVREYWLRVAENYGDALRAGELRAEIAEIDGKLADSAGGLTKAQQESSKSLVGNSAAAIANRSEILDLVGGYQEYIGKLAASGLSQSELQARTAQLKAEFMAQATQLGYNAGELQMYAAAFDDVTLAISKVPRNITVAANINPALQAINELEAKARSLAGQSYAGPTIVPSVENPARLTPVGGLLDPSDVGITRQALGLSNPQALILMGRQLYKQGFRSGGWTGDGNPWDVAGVVHKKEFVLNETGAQMLPMSTLNAMNQGRAPQMQTAAPARASGSSGPTTVVLDQAQFDALLSSGSVVVSIGPDQVAAAANNANQDYANLGRG